MWFNWLVQFKIFEALRHPQYRLLWISHVFSAMGTWMDQVSRGWLIYELTNSSFQLGLVRGVQALPILLLSPIAGSTADRYSRKSQVMVALVADAFFYGLLARADLCRLGATLACLCQRGLHGFGVDVSAAVAGGDGVRLRAAGIPD